MMVEALQGWILMCCACESAPVQHQPYVFLVQGYRWPVIVGNGKFWHCRTKHPYEETIHLHSLVL